MTNARILIVEDEILIARKIEQALRQLGHEVVGIAADAEMALQQVANAQPDLVLMDIVIQGEQDGITTAEQIRDRFQLPVVYLTAYTDDSTLERAKVTQPLGYILKPFNQQDLHVAIELALFRHQAEMDMQRRVTYSATLQSAQTNGKLQSQSEHLSMLSHELRNPLSIINFSATILEESHFEISEEKRQQYLYQIQSAAISMNQMLEDVLTLGQTESQQAQTTFSSLDISSFCQELIDSLRWGTDEYYSLTFSSQPVDIHAWVDEKLLWHLLSNLLSNAIKYSPQGGTIALTATLELEELCFRVQDQGIGIPAAEQKHLFEPFWRGSNVGKLPGTGLGLAIVHRAVELHSGRISVTSQVGQGTTIEVRLPNRAAEIS
jgi:signal transduction histidine kinase